MEILKPIEQSAIPKPAPGPGRRSKHQELYKHVLSLNGKALPIVFKDIETARRQLRTWSNPWSACRKRGIRVQQRGDTLYLSRASQ